LWQGIALELGEVAPDPEVDHLSDVGAIQSGSEMLTEHDPSSQAHPRTQALKQQGQGLFDVRCRGLDRWPDDRGKRGVGYPDTTG
jgi:hypothetical protein